MGNCLVYSSDPYIHTHQMEENSCITTTTQPVKDCTPFTPILPFSSLSDLNSVYSLGGELDRGQYGIIRSCKRRSSGALFACKSIAKVSLSDPQQMERIMSETCIMKRLSNSTCSFVDGIVRLHDIIEDKDSIHLILELCRGGDLYESITENKRYTEVHAAFLMKRLLESIHFCHSMASYTVISSRRTFF
ncbi:hypothetical protein KP509_34G028800 [Ceratopteris richardii]|uniref:Protein kinase domain-containing protein n=1 Tax=Ceratopteris richardii TaxID=49495 RepID=A0A8T2QI85_CERRI|nr:hypothetical protein KP509_34G028800 [Ceratopteris richardii]